MINVMAETKQAYDMISSSKYIHVEVKIYKGYSQVVLRVALDCLPSEDERIKHVCHGYIFLGRR